MKLSPQEPQKLINRINTSRQSNQNYLKFRRKLSSKFALKKSFEEMFTVEVNISIYLIHSFVFPVHITCRHKNIRLQLKEDLRNQSVEYIYFLTEQKRQNLYE